MTNTQKAISTFGWGLTLWLIGYIMGFAAYFLVPENLIGWVLMPFAALLTIWILLKVIKRPELMCYFGLGLVWTLIAVVLDFIFIVKLLDTGISYYKPDVYLYYALTFTLPMAVGYWKYNRKSEKVGLF